MARWFSEVSIPALVFTSSTTLTRRFTAFYYIMPSSEAISSLSESFDASSRASTPPPTSSTTPSNLFDACMRKSYPDVPASKVHPLPVNRKRKSKGRCVYSCQLCRNWCHGNRAIATQHIERHHPQYSESRPDQPSITSIFPTMNMETMLRNSFNKQRYKDALVGLFTRRRVPFSLIEWEEFRELCLSCNPEVEDLLISSRRQAVRLIVANYDLHRLQIKGWLQEAAGPIHLSTDLWTSPHRHALLAICVQWVDRDYNLRKALVGLPECRHDHLGEH